MATTFSEDQTTEKHVDHLSHLPRPSPQTVTSNTLPHHGHPHPTLLQPGPTQYGPSPSRGYGYSSGLTTPQSAPLVSDSMSSTVLPPLGMHQPGMKNTSPAGMDTTGQIAPPGIKPWVTATLWEDEGSLCFQVESRGICVARREDNHMINGTKLLNVAGMTRGRRDGILKSEKVRHVVKSGPLHLRGVWIPFERALDFANKENITEMLYPLFVHNISALLYYPSNQTRTNQAMAAAERRKAEAGGQMRNNFLGAPAPPSGVMPSIQLHSHHHHMALPGPQPSKPSLDRIYSFPTPPTSNSSVMGSMPSEGYQWPQAAMSSAQHPNPMSIDTSLSNARLMPATPAATPPDKSVQIMQRYPSETMVWGYGYRAPPLAPLAPLAPTSIYSGPNDPLAPVLSDNDESSSPKKLYLGEIDRKSENIEEAEPLDAGCEKSTTTRSPAAIGKAKNETDYSLSNEKKDINPQLKSTSRSGTTGMSNFDNMPEAPGESKNAHTQVGNLSPSQNSPQSDSEHSSDSEAGILTRNERRGILLERLMAYFFELLSSCPSPVPITTAESPMMPDTRNERQPTKDESTPAPLPPPEFLDQSIDKQASLSVPHSQNGLQNNQRRASSLYDDGCQDYKDQDDGPVKDGGDPTASQSRISGSVAASENKQSCASYQSNRSIQKRDREKEDDDKDEKQPGKRTRIYNDKNNAPKRLACPYFKNDPEHPQLGRSCSGPGWGTVHRLNCVRCYTAFDTEADRDTHMRLQDQCQVRERPGRMHGFDAAQKEQLRSRPKGYKHMSETQKWCHIYMILFPETASTEVPSPYYEFVSFRDSGHPVDPMTEYENFLRHEMPDRVRHQLELRIEEALNPLEETLRGQIVDIVRDVQLELFQSFRASTGPTRPNGDSVQESASIEIDDNPDKSQDEEREDTDAQVSTLVARNTEPPGQFDSGQCSWEEQLEAYRQVPPLDFSFTDFDDFDGALFDFSSVIPAAQDSAYGTLSISQEETDKDEFIGNGTGT
ncbi:hypothetical protein G7054_g3650 [Neopestalotiopsis clavispora]|nr:hypothetical protein G7054_g3650 [Neopestalotiopsis clavispora]